jgi:hypothetical protein
MFLSFPSFFTPFLPPPLQELSDHKYDPIKLKSLTMFLENILDSDIPITPSGSSSFPQSDTSSSYFSEDISIILTGLLDIIQRSTIELKSFIEIEQERSVLCEALRKALHVTELIVREKKNRKRILDPADVIWSVKSICLFVSLSSSCLSSRIMSILSNLESVDDQTLGLLILSHLVRSDQCRHEVTYLFDSSEMTPTIFL